MALPKSLEGKLRIPLIGAPLFIVSGPELVIAQCQAGIIGSFPALNARPQPALGDWLKQIKAALGEFAQNNPQQLVAPYAVNQIVHASNNRIYEDMETCVEHEVPIIITSLRPPEDVVKAVHSYGGLVFHDVISLRHARKAIQQGVDGVIAVCAGAGGHAGPLSPFALVKEIRDEFDGAIILSGCITSGSDVLAAKVMGADLAYSGTRFIASNEANAVAAYKEMIVDSCAADIAYSSLFTGIAGSYLKGSIINAGMDPDNLPESSKEVMSFSSAGESDAKAWKDIWGAGQGVGDIHAILPTRAIVLKFEKEYNDALAALVA